MRFSHLFCALTLISLGGCAFFIPENPSAPRYKPELGGRRVPSLNPQGGNAPAPADESMAAPVASITTADVPPPANPAFPPVDAATQAKADAVLAQSNAVPTTEAPRRAPAENQNPQLAANAPSFDSVPPRPAMSGPDSTEEQLNKVRAQLERDRAASGAAAGSLATDAAAEPSLLRDGAVAPLPPANIPAVTPRLNQGSSLTPPGAAPIALNPPSGFVAPVPLMPPPPAPAGGLAFAAPTPMATNEVSMPPAVASVPPPNNTARGLEPIMLRPPSNTPPPQRPAAPQQFAQPAELAPSNLPRSSSGFDPMASGTNTSSRSTTAFANDSGYLPPSRYTR